VRDLLRLKGEIIGQNFDAATLSAMTGEEVTPAVLDILRNDFQRTCSIDIEADSTVSVDQQAEQQSMAMVMQSVQGVLMGIQGMLVTQVMPPPEVINFGLELLKMFLRPVPHSRGVVDLINQLQEKTQQMSMLPPATPMPPAGATPPGGSTSTPSGGPPPRRPARPNGAPPIAGGPPGPPMLPT
jgi:hypothetical protein